MEIAAHLDGVYEDFHVFNLADMFEAHANLLKRIAKYDAKILSHLGGMPSADGFDDSGRDPLDLAERRGLKNHSREAD